MSISFGSLASTALQTTRSTFKAMAEAAGPQSEAGSDKAPSRPAVPAPAEPAREQRSRLDMTEPAEAAKPVKRRRGTVLDSYA